MSIEVICFCSFLSTINVPWRTEDHNANKFVKALKDEELNGYAYVPVLGVQRLLNNANRDDSIEWFGDLVAHFILHNGYEFPLVFVPVPNSSTTTNTSKRPRTRKLAKAIADRVSGDTVVSDCLRWKVELGSARKGGPRDAPTLFKNLIVTEKLDKKIRYVLVDDVTTSGGHLAACTARLKEKGATVIGAFCAGKTFQEPPHSAFDIFRETVEEYEP
jgi:hypothetical protein